MKLADDLDGAVDLELLKYPMGIETFLLTLLSKNFERLLKYPMGIETQISFDRVSFVLQLLKYPMGIETK